MSDPIGRSRTQNNLSREFQVPVGDLKQKELPDALRSAVKELEQRFPGLGIALWVFEYGQGGGLAYIGTASREDTIRVVLEWVDKQLGK